MTAIDTSQQRKAIFPSAVYWTTLFALFALYAIQVRSPLRLNFDACSILNLTAELTDGKPYLQNGARPVFPIGIPLTYSLMERAGIANSAGFGTLNLLCIVVAAWCTWLICVALSLRSMALIVMLIAFSNFVLIKHAVIPLTDVPYLMASMVCLAILEAAAVRSGSGKFALLGAALIVAALAIMIRRVGVALFPAIIFAAWPSKAQRQSLRSALRPRRATLIAVACLTAIALAAAAIALRKAVYAPEFSIGDSPARFVSLLVHIRLAELGEVLLNVPASQLHGLHILIPFAGALLAVLILAGLWRARTHLHPTHAYLLTYLAIMAVWPFGDARFWLPVLPLIAIALVQALVPLRYPWVKGVVIAYLVIYGLAALLAIGYSTRLTFAGPRFPGLYVGGAYRQRYEDAWTGKISAKDDNVIAIVRRYGMEGAPKPQ